MKAVQVLATYFGNRRNFPFDAVQVAEVLNQQITNLYTLDVGCDCDLLIVNHDIQSPGVYDYLSDIKGTQIKNGEVKVLNRPIVNKDLSFGSYKYAFHKLQNEYDYWFFNEDDILPLKENYIKEMIDVMDKDPSIGFVAALNFAKAHPFSFDEDGYIQKTSFHPPHAHGGVGLTSTKILKTLNHQLPEYFNTPNINPTSTPTLSVGGYDSDNIEINFTNAFTQIGYKLKLYNSKNNFKRLQDGSII